MSNPQASPLLRRLQLELDSLASQSQLRRLEILEGVNLCSNDYLGLANDPRLRDAVAAALAAGSPVGSTGSRLLSGNSPSWEALEEELAAFTGAEAALYFGSGYAANIGLFSSVLHPGDVVFSDSANHASIIDGIRLSGARKIIFPHLDLNFLEDALRAEACYPARQGPQEQARQGPQKQSRQRQEQVRQGPAEQVRQGPAEQVRQGPAEQARQGPAEQARQGPAEQVRQGPAEQVRQGPAEQARQGPAEQDSPQKIIAVESVFSMDGDRAPIAELLALAERYGAHLIFDEAHAVGVLGPQGRGLVAAAGAMASEQVLAVVYTSGKALAGMGAFVCGSQTLKNFLINRARSFIFATALPPYMAAQMRAAIHLVAGMERERAHLAALGTHLRARLRAAGFDTGKSESHIVPVMLGENRRALDVAAGLRKSHFAVRAIRPPTVAPGTARLRLSLQAGLTPEILDKFVDRLTIVCDAVDAYAGGAPK